MAVHNISQASHISVHISTSSSTLDLSQTTPLTITVRTILSAPHPLTFKKPFTPLFNGLFYNKGLTFRNIRTNEYVPRPSRHSQYVLSYNSSVPTERNKGMWITLYPDQAHTLEATFKPTLAIPPIQGSFGMTAAKMKQLQSLQTPVTTWNNVRSLKDGETYEIGITHTAAVEEWVQGSLEDILDATKAGAHPEASTDKIPFTIVQNAEITMARPDSDGSLSAVI